MEKKERLRKIIWRIAVVIFAIVIIFLAFYNIKDEDCIIKKGEAIGQGIFQKYLITDDDIAEGERLGGFGSTNK